MLKELFEAEKGYLDHFFEHVDLAKGEDLLKILVGCQGVIILSGVGKSGLVAEKIAATMTSTGSRAIFMSPINALHGDIGFVSEQDVFIMLSKSGESDELFNLIPTIRNKKAKLIAITSNSQSRLAKSSDFVMTLPLEKELCPFDLVPTTSTITQMLLGDALAIGLMSQKHFSLDRYAENHPAGRIGKRIVLKVKDLMLRDGAVPLCHGPDKLVDTLVELSNKRCGCVLIIDDQERLLGIFTDGDLRRALQKRGAAALNGSMQDFMTKNPRWIGPEKLAWDAMKLMEADQVNAITVLPVLEEDQKVAGLIKLHDIVQSGI